MTPGGNSPVSSIWPTELIQTLAPLEDASRVWVAFSGGLDSTLLLHLTCDFLQQHKGTRPLAIHVNHQLQTNSTETETFCQQVCCGLDVSLTVETVTVPVRQHPGTRTGGLEESARHARYRAFRRVLQAGDLLLMAHHGDDQVETLFFRVIRGSGLAGLAGMPQRRVLGKGELFRPLLSFSRDQLHAWASRAGLRWVNDPSNRDERFDRNFLRHRILPELRQRWPHLSEQLRQTSSQCREGYELTERLAQLQYAQCATPDHRIRVQALSVLTISEQKNLLAWWLRQAGLPVPSMRHWDKAVPALLTAGDDGAPEIRGQGFSVRRYNSCLYRVVDRSAVPEKALVLTPGARVSWGDFRLGVTATDPSAQASFRITSRQGGERIRERPQGSSRPLKKWLQDREVPPWDRNRLPLVWHDDQLIAVGDLWRAAGYTGTTPTSGWRVVCERDFN